MRKTIVPAYVQPLFETGTSRWRWTISRRGQTLASSTNTYPTEHDAMMEGRHVMHQVLAGELHRFVHTKLSP